MNEPLVQYNKYIPSTYQHPEGLPAHLGGHEGETHVDDGSLTYLINKFNIRSMLDVGCGPGGMIKLAKEKNLLVTGIDGDDKVEREEDVIKNIIIHDYCTGPFIPDTIFDLAWSVEFLEHVEAGYIPNYMPSFQKCKYVIATHAKPKPDTVNGKSATNYHHVNEQFEDYWIDIFNTYGFDYSAPFTKELRQASTMTKNFVRENGLVFIKR